MATTQRKCSRCLDGIKKGEQTRHNAGNNSITHSRPCKLRHISECSQEEVESMTAAEAFARGADWWQGR